jgi:hypothetical protein
MAGTGSSRLQRHTSTQITATQFITEVTVRHKSKRKIYQEK